MPRAALASLALLLPAAAAGAAEDLPLPAEKISITVPHAVHLVTCHAAVVGRVVSADARKGELVLQVEETIRGEVEAGRLAVEVRPAEHAKPLNRAGTPAAVFLRRAEGGGWRLDGTAARGGAVIWNDTALAREMLAALKDPEAALRSRTPGTRQAAAYYLALLHAMRQNAKAPQVVLNTAGLPRADEGERLLVRPPPEWAELVKRDRKLRIAGAMRPLIEALAPGLGRNVNAAGRDAIQYLVRNMNLNQDRRFKYSVYLPDEDKREAAAKVRAWWEAVEATVRARRGEGAPEAPALPEEEREKITRLIAQLGARKWEDREEAQAELEGLREEARILLVQATGHPDAEVARRAEAILEPEEQAGALRPERIEDLEWLVPRATGAPAMKKPKAEKPEPKKAPAAAE